MRLCSLKTDSQTPTPDLHIPQPHSIMERRPPKNNISPLNKMPLLEYGPALNKPSSFSFFGNRAKNTQQYFVPTFHPLYVDYNKKPKRKLHKRGTITYNGIIEMSETPIKVQGIFPYDGSASGVHQAIKDNIDIKYSQLNYTLNWDKIDVTITTRGEVKPLVYTKNKMRDHAPFSVVNLFNNIIDIETTSNNCVPDTLAKLFPKIATQKKNPIAKLKEATTEQVMEFCKEHGIRAIAYNVHKEVIAEHIPEVDNKRYATLAYLYYNNHMYPIKHKFLKEKPTPTKHEHQTEEVLQEHFRTLINQKIVPANIRLDGYTVTSFVHNDTTYFLETTLRDNYVENSPSQPP